MDNNYTIKTKSAPNWIYDWTKSIISVIFVVLIILTFFFRIVNVDGTSMYSTLYDGDKLFVSSFLYTPTDGDIVIISHGQYLDEPIVKRVIATEGQTLKIDFDKEKVYVDGKELNEPYVSSELIPGDAKIPEVIPEGKIFVMGDNRYVSEVGLINVKDVIGKAQFTLFPFNHAKYLY